MERLKEEGEEAESRWKGEKEERINGGKAVMMADEGGWKGTKEER